MTGYAASKTFPETPGMSHCGRFQSLSSLAKLSECSTRNGKFLPESGRLVNNYLIII